MFNYFKGIITDKSVATVTLEVGGIGYELGISTSALSAINVGDEVKLYSYMAVREDGISLYGFTSKNEKNMFLRLISISGIGPKVALAVLSGLSAKQLAEAVISGNLAALSSVKGIGKKTAERIVLELKDKITDEFAAVVPGVGADAAVLSGSNVEEAVFALISLGYSKAEAAAAVSRIKCDGLKPEEIILLALKG